MKVWDFCIIRSSTPTDGCPFGDQQSDVCLATSLVVSCNVLSGDAIGRKRAGHGRHYNTVRYGHATNSQGFKQ